MLILTVRVTDGPIWLINEDTGQEVQVNLLDVKGSQLKLGFTADQNISILRDKIYQENHQYD
tara:strand:+ start:1166 stop:1351 length:186 start_codon:yes stop_codon:yes gene_type:complete